ncbi:hypothetical protein Leryth_019854 [Lithospermum erythrorhizon]|nr:hypothetical protein Leryth_019854 [Lithospermum erythrorhizon]
MVLKRYLGDGSEDESEFPSHEPKRRNVISSLAWNLFKGPQELAEKFEPILRKLVREEVESAISSAFIRPCRGQNDLSGSSAWQLRFDNNIPDMLFTSSKVESLSNGPVKITLYDANSNQIVASGPLSSLKITIVVVDGDFDPDDQEDWTEQEFSAKILHQREGKRPLLTGELTVQLQDGVGSIGDICFSDNSSWIRGRKFRLGAKVHTVSNGIRIREGVSKKFTVKDHRGESYKKHYPPYANDDLWRLEKIAKDGALHQRLASKGIRTVKDLLRWLIMGPDALRNIIGTGISDKKWKAISAHATSCILDDKELYIYTTEEGISIVFNAIYKVQGAIFDYLNYQSLDKFDPHQKLTVERLKHRAYGNLKDLVPWDGPPIRSTPQFSSPQTNSYDSLGLGPLNVDFPVQQDQADVQMISDQSTISPSYTCELDDNPNQLDVSMAESSHRMQNFDPAFRNSFAFDPYYILNTEGHGFDQACPTGPQMLLDQDPGENFLFPTAIQGKWNVSSSTSSSN